MLRLVVMATSWLTMLSPMLSQGIGQATHRPCAKVLDSESVRKKHAQSCCVRRSTRFARRHARCYAFSRHAFGKSPPAPPPGPSLSDSAPFDVRSSRLRGQEGQTAVEERMSLNARCVQNLFHARTLIFTCLL